MRFFVTGATGFLGGHFAAAALAAGHSVRALRRPASPSRTASGPEWIEGRMDAAEPGWFEGCDALFHFAAAGVSPQPVDWRTAHRVNVSDSISLLETAAAAGVKRFLLCGSCLEFGRSCERFEFVPPDAPLEPAGPYATSKAAFAIAAAGFARSNRLGLHLLRPFHLFGEGQFADNLWPSLRSAALAGRDFPMTAGGQQRDFMPVEAAAKAFLEAVDAPSVPGTLMLANIGSGRTQSLREFAEAWWREWKAPGRLLAGALPYRAHEVMRCVPEIGTWKPADPVLPPPNR